ncbi:MAG: T9SS type A sorting domain-containing protein [Bacteroidales bacterium]|nr:T9SS type A sorting domain-containing protein [Bacteroidales bacterium]
MHWNDGNRDNPRIVPLTHDTAFVAFFGVEESYVVDASSRDDSLGYVSGGGWYYLNDTAIIEACPRRVNARFIRWNDGNCDNPRSVFVTQDTAFSAFFDTVDMFDVELLSSDDDLGYVTGTGRYCDSDTVVIRAYPRYFSVARFVRWSDGIYFNPRNLCVTQDTIITAIFERITDIAEAESVSGLFSLHPNPTGDDVTIVFDRRLEAPVRVTVHDAVGHGVTDVVVPKGEEKFKISLRGLPSGTYFVSLHMPDGTYMQKVVLQ